MQYYVAIAQNPKCNLNRSKIFDALNSKNRAKSLLATLQKKS
ncbi:hypothetical protein CYK57_01803 [Actinobacillus pleuropneumoniae]|nr:hypothetical protein appser9_16970 [Actinobacillus pleuropneumoniae serovar 9 str. CVJ13261]EFM95739.1 hypothetical protein appser10_16270 [Actinobacillus pleuropneumoniae serovar 10 str. D13039]EFM97826.1 hypothetical protein appser11_17100 [Actinobacillus pleuropneumoniae serovar 11 str. 56153]QSZ39625.1 hypothetical protein CYK57_01803 [Actinobacillus pleuropneumoniae]